MSEETNAMLLDDLDLDEVAERIEYEKALVAAFLSRPNRYLYQLKDLNLENPDLKTLAFVYLTDESEKTLGNYRDLGLPEQNCSSVVSYAKNVNYNSRMTVRDNLFRSLKNEKLKNKTRTFVNSKAKSFSSFKKQLGHRDALGTFCVTSATVTVVGSILSAAGSILSGGLLAPVLWGINALVFSWMISFTDTHKIPKAPKNIKQSVRKYNVSEVINHFSNEIPQPQHEQNENQFVQQQSIYPRIPDIIDRANIQNLQATQTQPMTMTFSQHNLEI